MVEGRCRHAQPPICCGGIVGAGAKVRVKSVLKAAYRQVMTALPPRISIAVQFFRGQRRFPDLRNPVRFSDKIQARKFGIVDPRFVRLSDKVLVKDHVAETLGQAWVIPTLWCGEVLPETPLWPLPIVVKANHGSGWNVFVADARTWGEARDQAQLWLSRSWEVHLQERHYNEIEPQILVEPRIGDGADLPDYKFMVFHGRVEMVQVDTDRFTDHRRAFYDRQWRLQPFGLKYPRVANPLPRPRHLDQMVAAAETLGQPFDFVRVDFYDLPDHPKFGEMTFTPGSGYERFNPPEYDEKLGRLWKLLPN